MKVYKIKCTLFLLKGTWPVKYPFDQNKKILEEFIRPLSDCSRL